MPRTNKQRRLAVTLLKWYDRHGRALPWRNISNPYHILVSEIMLQQTQVSRVLEKYPEFLCRFPTMHSLARATQREVVVTWRGMGYNNRAVRLHKLAQIVADLYGGRLPKDYQQLIALPGIGPYTANALLSSAFGRGVPVVDVNVRRFLSRLFWRMDSTREMRAEKEIWRVASRILPRRKEYAWNQALMDMGATVCTARRPVCDRCPVATLCASRTLMRWTPPSGLIKRKTEIPGRIFRGRIIEELRNLKAKQSIRLDVLGKRIRSGFTRGDETWLRALLRDLEKDALVVVHGNGSLKTSTVSLA